MLLARPLLFLPALEVTTLAQLDINLPLAQLDLFDLVEECDAMPNMTGRGDLTNAARTGGAGVLVPSVAAAVASVLCILSLT